MSKSRTPEQIHEEQEALIEAEVEPADVESDEDQAPVSAKEALKCCLLCVRTLYA